MRGATSKKPGKRTEQPAPRPEYGRGTGVPNPIDVEVGGRIRTRRLLLGMNQQALAVRSISPSSRCRNTSTEPIG
jgi:hypothetical protein